MKLRKNANRIALVASSPKQLSVNLKETIEKNGMGTRVVAVSIDDPKIIMCPFQLESAKVKDLEHHLLSEAVEIMSLTPDEIVLDFQITKSDEKMVHGIYICIPKNLFKEYLNVLDKKSFNPAIITEQFLVSVNSLFQKGKLSEGRVCFLDFSTQGTINLFISNKQEYELLRKIRYEDYDEAQKEIIQSLRSASAKSRVKHYDHIYYHSELEQIDELAEFLKKKLNTEIKELAFIDHKEALVDERTYFKLNLLRKYNFPPKQLKYIHAGVNIVIALCVMNLGLIGLQMIKKDMEISRVREYYQDTDYEYAVELSDNLK